MINVVFTLLTPLAANLSYIAVLVVRFIEGLGAVSSAAVSPKFFEILSSIFKIYLLNLGSLSTSCSRYADQMGFATREKFDNFFGLRR